MTFTFVIECFKKPMRVFPISPRLICKQGATGVPVANEDLLWDPCKRTCRTRCLLFSLWFAFMVVHVWKHGKGLLRLLNSSSLRPSIHSVLQVMG